MRGVLLQSEEMADPGAVPSLEHLCVSTVEDNLTPHNVCRTLEAIAVLQPALQELLDHLLQFLCRHLKEVLSNKVSFILLAAPSNRGAQILRVFLLSLKHESWTHSGPDLFLISVPKATLSLKAGVSVIITALTCSSLQADFICLPFEVLNLLLGRQSMVRILLVVTGQGQYCM